MMIIVYPISLAAGATGIARAATGPRWTIALNPLIGSAVYITVRTLPSGSTNEYDPKKISFIVNQELYSELKL